LPRNLPPGFSESLLGTIFHIKSKNMKIMKKPVKTIVLAFGLAVIATGCATHQSSGTMPQALYTPGVGYHPNFYSQPVYSPPTIHYTGSGVGAIQAGLMNNMGRIR
jgi:hypothetical protein